MRCTLATAGPLSPFSSVGRAIGGAGGLVLLPLFAIHPPPARGPTGSAPDPKRKTEKRKTEKQRETDIYLSLSLSLALCGTLILLANFHAD
jgi:hypothetical protein